MKIIIFVFLTLLIYSQGLSQNNYTVIVDSTIFGIRDFYAVKTPGTNLKDIYIQEGMTQGPFGLVGGRYFKINDQRTGKIQVPFLNPVQCPEGNYYPVTHIERSRTDPNIFIFNGMYSCGGENGDYNKLTRDGGQTIIDLPFGGGNNGQQCYGFGIDPYNPVTMYMIHKRYNSIQYEEPMLFKSTNSGSNWVVVSKVSGARVLSEPWASSGVFSGFLKISPWRQYDMLARNYSILLASRNAGVSFEGMALVTDIKFIFLDEWRRSYHAVSSNNLIYSNYGDVVFDNWLPAIQSYFNVTCVETDQGYSGPNRKWYGGSINRIYKTTNSGQNWNVWHNFSSGIEKVIGISKDIFIGDTLIVGTDKRVYKFWPTLTGGVQEGIIPGSYELKQNYPNPFNPSTDIKFSLPVKTFLILKVYDIRGNEVRVLASGSFDQGTHIVNFNASDLASGVYYYRIESESFSANKKMILIK